MRAWVNGQLLENPSAPAVSVADHGLTVGDGVFEAIKVVDGQPFALTRHLRRLATSARGLGLAPPDEAVVRRAVDEVLNGQQMELGRIRITLTGGVAPLGSGRGDAPQTLIVVAAPMAAYPSATSVITVPWPRNERGALAGLKTTSYAENVVALARAAEAGASEAIFANTAGNLCEGTGSNIFYVVEGELRTPTLASGCLAGISRELLLEWLRESGEPVAEVDESIAVLERAREIFLVSTTRDVQAVDRCDGRAVSTGPVTERARELWRAGEARTTDP